MYNKIVTNQKVPNAVYCELMGRPQDWSMRDEQKHQPTNKVVKRELLIDMQILGGGVAITWYRLARLLGLRNSNNVYRWKNGTRKPSAYHVQQIKLLLKMKLQYSLATERINRIDWSNNLMYFNGPAEPKPYLHLLTPSSVARLQSDILNMRRPELRPELIE